MPSALKSALEDLLRARRLQAEAPPLRGEDRRLSRLPTGIPAIDDLLGGGFPRGQLSEVHGPCSSGRTGLMYSLLARCTAAGGLSAWVDPGDRLDPVSAEAAGVDLGRLLWLRGRKPNALPDSLSAASTVLGSGLFEAVILDLAGIPWLEIHRLPGSTWIRLQRMIEDNPSALLLLADAHTARSAGGISLELRWSGPRWSGSPGPGRLLRGLAAEARTTPWSARSARLELQAFV